MRDFIFFFTVEQEGDIHKICLKKFQIKDGANLSEQVSEVITIKLAQSVIDMEIPGGKVLGATIIPNLEENDS